MVPIAYRYIVYKTYNLENIRYPVQNKKPVCGYRQNQFCVNLVASYFKQGIKQSTFQKFRCMNYYLTNSFYKQFNNYLKK